MSLSKLSTLDRRSFISQTAKNCFGITLGGSIAELFNSPAFAEANHPAVINKAAKAKHVIYLYMAGGMTHLDTFDPKPNAGNEITGGKTAIGTAVDGIQLSEHLPLLAKHTDKLAIVRSMNSTQGAHAQGNYFMRTGYTPRASITHPTAGGWINRLTPPLNKTIPGFVTVNCGNIHPGAGFLEPNYHPLPIGNALEGLKNSKRQKWSTEESFQQQLDLRKVLDHDFDAKFAPKQKTVRAYNEMYDSAVKLMRSRDLEAFDLSKESTTTHRLYGESNFSKGCLLARRLVERGVRFIEVELGGFDWHDNVFENAAQKLPMLDQGFSALLEDLQVKGLLDSTLVVLATEFGRTPKITQNAGRNHFPKAFSCVMAGGGIKGGHIHGSTDETGANVSEGKTTAKDFNATIGHALGIDYNQIIHSSSKRPFSMNGKDGKPLLDMFS